MKGCFLSPAKHLACFCNYHRSDLFSASFQSLFHRLHRSLYWSHTDFQYRTAASIALTKLPFCYNNSSQSLLHLCISTSVVYMCALCEMKAPPRQHVWSTIQSCLCARPFIRTLHSCWTQLHHMPLQIQYYRSVIQFPALSANRKEGKKRKRDSNSPTLHRATLEQTTAHSPRLHFDWNSQ